MLTAAGVVSSRQVDDIRFRLDKSPLGKASATGKKGDKERRNSGRRISDFSVLASSPSPVTSDSAFSRAFAAGS